MRVLCIDQRQGPIKTCWHVVEGEIYTVSEEYVQFDGVFYGLIEDPDHILYSWSADRFIPLSNIDETELIKERQDYGARVEN